MTAVPEPCTPRILVIGAGPVGLAAALLLADQGHDVTVYEGKESLELSDGNSYPIGVNLRGQETLRRIDPALLEQLRERAEVVEAFHIYTGTRRVARLESGTLLATTRAFLTSILLERVRAHASIAYEPGHRLTSLDLATRTLAFARPDGTETTVEAGDARVIAADGVWSPSRRSLEEQVPDFQPRVGDWGVQFRVAYSQPHASAPGLDPTIHHIFTSKGIYTSTLKNGLWGVALTAIEGDDAEDLLLSTEASEANIAALRAHVEQHAPLAAPLLTRDDYAAFFSREPFGGAVVLCPQLAFEEWIVLLGDAAHSVLPPTGEGVNSGLEDAALLAEGAATGLSPTWFADYEALRLPDLRALGTYAWTLRDNIRSTDPARGAANVVLRIVDSIAAGAHLPSAQVEARLFGPDAGRTPYREAIGPWIRQRQALFPVAQGVAGAVRDAVSTVRGVAAAARPGSDRTDDAHVHRLSADSDPTPKRIVVVGASSGTGQALVTLARDAGHDVTAVSRSGDDVDGVREVRGDASDAAIAREAVAGADAVVVTVGGSKENPRARTEVTRTIVEAMREAGVERLVIQTSLGAGDSASQLPWLQRRIAPKLLAGPLADHDAQEDVVRASGLRWTIVRPAGLTNRAGTGRWQARRSDEPGSVGGTIARADVAACLLSAITDDTTVGAQLGISGA